MMGWAPRRYALGRMMSRIAARPITFAFSVLAAAAALVVPVLCAALAAQLWSAPLRLAVEPEISVFIAPGTGGAEIKALMGKLHVLPAITSAALVPRETALAELTARSGLERAAGAVAELKTNPLPDVLIARLRNGTSADAIDELAAGVRKWNRIDAVVADTGWYRKWSLWRQLFYVAACTMAAIAALLLVWVVASAVRLQVAADGNEVRTLLMVGADERFLRRPYVYLGAATTGLAMAVASATAALVTDAAAPKIAALSALYKLDLAWGRTPWTMFALAVLVAAVLGGAIAAWGVPRQSDRDR
jgi:cell division transport system permease protein